MPLVHKSAIRSPFLLTTGSEEGIKSILGIAVAHWVNSSKIVSVKTCPSLSTTVLFIVREAAHVGLEELIVEVATGAGEIENIESCH